LLPNENGDETKISYLLGIEMGMRMNFQFGDENGK